ncbi:MAG: DUF2064 domain-containing protein [Marmoricola sp.]
MSAGRALVVAKAPVSGRVKTRLGAAVGMELAAELAAAALLDTVAACTAAFEECHLALEGRLAESTRAVELAKAFAGWSVFEQTDGDLGRRLAHAHEHVGATGTGPVVQVGMDTPQLTPDLLRQAAASTTRGAATLGPAADGGWWVLALADPRAAQALAGVVMSTPETGRRTEEALRAAGVSVRPAPLLQDVDTAVDAAAVASAAPATRFAAAWRLAQGAA